MTCSETSTYSITNGLSPMATVNFTPSISSDGVVLTLTVEVAVAPAGTVLAHAFYIMYEPGEDQEIEVSGGGITVSGFIVLKNNVLSFNGQFGVNNVVASIQGPIACFFPEGNNNLQLTQTFSMNAGPGGGANIPLTLAPAGGSIPGNVNYNFGGVGGTVAVASGGKITVDQGDIGINGEVTFVNNTYYFRGSFIKSSVIQIDFASGVFGGLVPMEG